MHYIKWYFWRFFAMFLFFNCTIAFTQNQSNSVISLPSLTVEGASERKSLSGLSLVPNDIESKSAQNIGETLNDQLGFSSSSFGQSANRPIIRGMSGSRVPILQNGSVAGDVSSISADHAVASDVIFNQKIEVLRGGDSLRFSSGANQGLINIIDNRIPTEILASPSISLSSQYNFNQQGLTNGILIEDTLDKISIHVDETNRSSNNYLRPDGQLQPYSFSKQNDFGVGATYFRDNGYTGFSFSQFKTFYGIPSSEGSQIDLIQKRFSLVNQDLNPFDGINKMVSKLSYSNYSHQEISTENIPQTEFKNTSLDGRFEFFHQPINNWNGSFGLQFVSSNLSAIDLTNPLRNSAVIPPTKSNQLAVFVVENTSYSNIDIQNGLRYEWVQRNPNSDTPYTDYPNFSVPSNGSSPSTFVPTASQFSLISLSTEALWNYKLNQSIGFRYSFSQRAPAVDELYSFGNHDATASFDVGNPLLQKESSNHFELGWRQHTGYFQGKFNIYKDFVQNFIYTQFTGAYDLGTNNPVRQFSQANASIQGVESELTLNKNGDGWSSRVFGDYSEGTLNDGGYLPLQPATRLGLNIGYKKLGWKSQASLIHALGQYKTASSAFYSEPTTSAYNKLDARISKSQAIGQVLLTYYVQANNLLNDTIRYSTTIDTIRLNAPQPGRSIILGFKLDY